MKFKHIKYYENLNIIKYNKNSSSNYDESTYIVEEFFRKH
jgi:hypothetical protein